MKFISAVLGDNGKGSNVDKVFADGLYVAGQRYVAFNIEGRHVYGRQVCTISIPLLCLNLCRPNCSRPRCSRHPLSKPRMFKLTDGFSSPQK